MITRKEFRVLYTSCILVSFIRVYKIVILKISCIYFVYLIIFNKFLYFKKQLSDMGIRQNPPNNPPGNNPSYLATKFTIMQKPAEMGPRGFFVN